MLSPFFLREETSEAHTNDTGFLWTKVLSWPDPDPRSFDKVKVIWSSPWLFCAWFIMFKILCFQNSPKAPALTHGFWTGDIDLCYKDGAIPYDIFPFVALGFAENDQQSFKIIVAPQVGIFSFDNLWFVWLECILTSFLFFPSFLTEHCICW